MGCNPSELYFGTLRFEGDQTPSEVEAAPSQVAVPSSTEFSGYSISELFQMEEAGDITTEELIAELEHRNGS